MVCFSTYEKLFLLLNKVYKTLKKLPQTLIYCGLKGESTQKHLHIPRTPGHSQVGEKGIVGRQ